MRKLLQYWKVVLCTVFLIIFIFHANDSFCSDTTQLCADEYRWGEPAPGFSFANWPIFESWSEVRFVNSGPADAFNVTATIACAPTNVTVVDGEVSLGDIPAGCSAWSVGDTFTLQVDMDNPQDPDEGIAWKVEFDDESGNHHVELVGEFCDGSVTCFDAAAVIGPEGGIFEVTNPDSPAYGIKIIFPDGALQSEEMVTVDVVESPPDLPEGVEAVTPTVDIKVGNDVKLQKMVLVEFPLSQAHISDTHYVACHFNNGSAEWDISQAWYETSSHIVFGAADHFCFWVFCRRNNVNSGSLAVPDFDSCQDRFDYVNQGYAYCNGMSFFTKWFFENKRRNANYDGSRLRCRYDDFWGKFLAMDTTEIAKSWANLSVFNPGYFLCEASLKNILLDRLSQGKLTVVRLFRVTLEPSPRFPHYKVDDYGTHFVVVYAWELTDDPFPGDGKFLAYCPNDEDGLPVEIIVKTNEFNGVFYTNMQANVIDEDWELFSIGHLVFSSSEFEGLFSDSFYQGGNWCDDLDGDGIPDVCDTAEVLLEDDFEDGDASDWLTFSSAQIAATTSHKYEGSFGGRFINSPSGGCGYEGPGKFSPAYKEFSPQTGIFTIEFHGMSDGQGGAYNWRRFGFSDVEPESASYDRCNRIDPDTHHVGGVSYSYDYEFCAIMPGDLLGQYQSLGVFYTPYQWNFFRFVVDVPNQQFTIFIDGIDTGTYPFYRSVSNIKYFMMSSEYKYLYIDDIKIYEGE